MDTKTMTSTVGQVMVNTVADNKSSSCTNADYLQALAPWKLQIKIGNPTA